MLKRQRSRSKLFWVCVSAGWSLGVTVWQISTADRLFAHGSVVHRHECFLPLIWPAGFVSGHVSVPMLPGTGTTAAVEQGPFLVHTPKSPQDPTIKTNRPRVLFPQQWRHVSPPPSPQVKTKHWGKTSVSVTVRGPDAVRCAVRDESGRERWRRPRVFCANLGDLGAGWLALERWRERRKWSHLTDRPCYYCYFGSPVMRRAGEPLVSETTSANVTAGRRGPTPPSPLTRAQEPRWRLGQRREEEEEEGVRTQLTARLLHSGRPKIKRRQKQ